MMKYRFDNGRPGFRAGSLMLVMIMALTMFLVSGCVTRVSAPTDDGARASGALFTPEVLPATADPAATGEGGDPADSTAVPSVTGDPGSMQGRLAGLVICVDPGHQGAPISEKEPCAPWGPESNASVNNTTMKAKATAGTQGKTTGVTEYQLNLEISLILKDMLEAEGATVVMSRTDNSSRISNRERAIMANENKCDITFNIHCNGSDNTSVSGIELYVRGSGDNTQEYAARSAAESALGQKLLDKLAASTGAKKRYVNKSDSYTGINWRDHTTFIIECGFLSSPEEEILLSTPDYQKKIASAIVNFAIEDYNK